MTKPTVAFCCFVLALQAGLAGTGALAGGTPATEVMPGNQGSMAPGGLAPTDVNGKWLLDANGVELGRIEGSAPDGRINVRAADGRHFTVNLQRLSLGNGPNTVIEGGNSDADKLNRMEGGTGR